MKKLMLSACLIAAAFGAHAQSKIQCVLSADGSTYQAAQIWQNTLGVQRANMICQQQAKPSTMERHAKARVEGQVSAPAGRFTQDQYAKAMSMATDHSGGAKGMPVVPQNHGTTATGTTEVPMGYAPMW